MLTRGSKSFAAAAALLPSDVRDSVTCIYAFCRVADDLVDNGRDKSRAVKQLAVRLDAICEGRPFDDPVDRAFGWAMRRHGIPEWVVRDLIQGFEWEVDGRTYNTLDGLASYSYRVAGTVGLMVSHVVGVTHPRALRAARDLGIAMQLTNIARDVGEDARAGRLYLPTGWLLEAGLDPTALLANPHFTVELGGVVSRLLQGAERFYERGNRGIAYLPPRVRPAIQAASDIYRAIGVEIADNGFDSVTKRAMTSKPRKLALGLRSLTISLLPLGGELWRSVRALIPDNTRLQENSR